MCSLFLGLFFFFLFLLWCHLERLSFLMLFLFLFDFFKFQKNSWFFISHSFLKMFCFLNLILLFKLCLLKCFISLQDDPVYNLSAVTSCLHQGVAKARCWGCHTINDPDEAGCTQPVLQLRCVVRVTASCDSRGKMIAKPSSDEMHSSMYSGVHTHTLKKPSRIL